MTRYYVAFDTIRHFTSMSGMETLSDLVSLTVYHYYCKSQNTHKATTSNIIYMIAKHVTCNSFTTDYSKVRC